jgi:hypothetical protein
MPVSRPPTRACSVRFNPIHAPPNKINEILGYRVSSGFIGGSGPPQLPSEVIEIEETQRADAEGTHDSMAPNIALSSSTHLVSTSHKSFPMPSPLGYNAQAVQTDPPRPSTGPSRKSQAAQTDHPRPNRVCKGYSAHTVHHTSCEPWTSSTSHSVHHAYCAPCTFPTAHSVHHACCAPCTFPTAHSVHHACCAPCTFPTAHSVHHACCAPCTTCAPSTCINESVSLSSQGHCTKSIKPSQLTINSYSLEDIIQQAREDGYNEAMGHVANKLEDVFENAPSDSGE